MKTEPGRAGIWSAATCRRFSWSPRLLADKSPHLRDALRTLHQEPAKQLATMRRFYAGGFLRPNARCQSKDTRAPVKSRAHPGSTISGTHHSRWIVADGATKQPIVPHAPPSSGTMEYPCAILSLRLRRAVCTAPPNCANVTSAEIAISVIPTAHLMYVVTGMSLQFRHRQALVMPAFSARLVFQHTQGRGTGHHWQRKHPTSEKRRQVAALQRRAPHVLTDHRPLTTDH